MKRVALIALFLVSCKSARTPAKTTQPPASASAPVVAPVSSETLADHAGDSTDSAVEVPADATDGGLDFENHWIFDRFGRFRRRGGGTGVLNDRRYDAVKIELPNGEQKTVYFDITENWKRWTPPQ
jgi:hypothetical protein